MSASLVTGLSLFAGSLAYFRTIPIATADSATNIKFRFEKIPFISLRSLDQLQFFLRFVLLFFVVSPLNRLANLEACRVFGSLADSLS